MKKLYMLIMVLSVIAWGDALYLTYHALTGVTQSLFYGSSNPMFCDLSATFSCSEVLKNVNAQIFGFPFPSIAILVYPVLFSLALLGYALQKRKFARILAPLAFCGMLFNFYFVSIEYFKIGAYCPLCLLCTAIITTIFIASLTIIFKGKKSSAGLVL